MGNVCGVVIQRDGKYLLVQERLKKAYGKWNLPGGHVDDGETLEAAAEREAMEEVGIEVEAGRQLIVIERDIQANTLHAYEGLNPRGDVKVQEDELLDAQWFSYEEVKAMKDDLRSADYVLGGIEATL